MQNTEMKLVRSGFWHHWKTNQSRPVVFMKSRTFICLRCQIKGGVIMTTGPCVPSAPSLVQCWNTISSHYSGFSPSVWQSWKIVRLLSALITDKRLVVLRTWVHFNQFYWVVEFATINNTQFILIVYTFWMKVPNTQHVGANCDLKWIV